LQETVFKRIRQGPGRSQKVEETVPSPSPMRLPEVLAIVALGAALAGCSAQRSETPQDSRAKMAGMQQNQVLACMGTPTRKILETVGEVWEYSTGNGTTSTNASTAVNSNNFSSRLCDINIVFSKGQVSAVEYAGPLGGAPVTSDQCANAISSCVKQR
jgi:hypothetical protein